MRKETVEWSIRMLVDLQPRINTDEEYQRGKVWSTPQQALLIDSILRGFDIPKIYVRKHPPGGNVLFDVVDGKQRLTAIWRFLSNEFPLHRNADDFPRLGNLSGKRWSQLPAEAQDVLQFSSVTVSAIEDASKEDVRELFVRLQKGEPLNAAEKRNAIAGPIRDFVAEHMSRHNFWPLTRIRQRRFGYEDHSAILLALVKKGGPTALKGADLQAMYEEEQFDEAGPYARRSIELLDELNRVAEFGPEVLCTRWGLVDLALCLLRASNEASPIDSAAVMEFYKAFEERRQQVASTLNDLQTQLQEKTDEDEAKEMSLQVPSIEPDMLSYHLAFTREGGMEENVRRRYEIMYQRMKERLEGSRT